VDRENFAFLYGPHKYTMWAKCRIFSVKPGCIYTNHKALKDLSKTKPTANFEQIKIMSVKFNFHKKIEKSVYFLANKVLCQMTPILFPFQA
jgi:hypothetical protein